MCTAQVFTFAQTQGIVVYEGGIRVNMNLQHEQFFRYRVDLETVVSVSDSANGNGKELAY